MQLACAIIIIVLPPKKGATNKTDSVAVLVQFKAESRVCLIRQRELPPQVKL